MGIGLILLLGLAGAGASAAIVVLMLRGRTSGSPVLWGAGAIVAFYAVGNLMNRVVFPALFGDQLQLLLEHQQPVWSIADQALASWAVAFAVTLGVAGIVRWRAAGSTRGTSAAPPAPPQLVGSICIVCGNKIVMEPDGTRCDRCRAPLHTGCAPSHSCAGA
jgi:hypothetical protein